MQHRMIKISPYFNFCIEEEKSAFIPLYWDRLTLTNFLYCVQKNIQRMYILKEGAHETKSSNAKLVTARGTFLPQPPAWPQVLCCPPPCTSLQLLHVHLLWGQELSVAQLFIIRTAQFQIRSQKLLLSTFLFSGFFPDHFWGLKNSKNKKKEKAHLSGLVKKLKDSNLAQQHHLQKSPLHLGWGGLTKMEKKKNKTCQLDNVGIVICWKLSSKAWLQW